MLKKFVRLFGGDPNKKVIEKYSEIVAEINALEPQFEGLDDETLKGKTAEFRARLEEGEDLDDLLPEAFAAVREASKRTLGQRHYDVQLIGGTALHQGSIAEMRTGEGKTLVATLPLYLNALTRRGVHLITVNDYLARRDARWMAPIYNLLGMSVGVLQMAARTENGKKAFIVDLERESPHEDQHQLSMVPRQEAYAADITYGTNSEFGFDYLRDNMTYRLEDRVQRGHYYAVVDEVDNVLIDEARTPLIISGPAHDDTEWYVRMAQVVKRLRPEDYEINEHDRTITLSEIGEAHVEELLEIPLRDPDRPEDVTPEQARLMGYLEQALRAQYLFRRNKDYLVQAGKVIIIDEFTGRLMPGRRWSDGLHQAVEAKEGARVQAENITYATITIQNYFRMYDKLAGMTGTAITEAEEFSKIYKLEVVAIPTNLEYQAAQPDSELAEMEGKDEDGYKYIGYVHRDPLTKKPVKDGEPIFWKRKDYPDVIYRTEEAKFRAITQEIFCYHVMGRPMLVGTTSVELSDRLSSRLRAEPIRRLAQALIIRDAWIEKNNREMDGRLIPELQLLDASLDSLPVSEMRKMASDLGVPLNSEDSANLKRLRRILRLGEADQPRLLAVLKAGIPHQVLNARKHTEESQIIAGAGAFGAVTIATNMAGRGVDIKLGGELAEEIIGAVNRVLRRTGYRDPYDMNMEERRQALLDKDPAGYGIYEGEVRFFLQQLEDMEQVKRLGGLHVIGSERHEARRIDNQLRGRSARQGDPGSSRFYLSMEDELMRRFGGQQANDLMQRLKIDDSLPLEMGIVSRLVEQSQTRVEGANFDVRKHLLEYDDVLNAQRKRIYEQRDRIFTKDDLSEDVTEMLRTEVKRRVPQALKDEEGPWRLLAWLDGIQPPLAVEGAIFPSFTYRLLLEHLSTDAQAQVNPQAALLTIAEGALRAEEEHLLHSLQTLIATTRERMESQLRERLEALDTFIEGLNLEENEDREGENTRSGRSSRELADEISSLLRVPVRLSPEQQRALKNPADQEALESIAEDLRAQVETAVATQAFLRLIGAMERRMDESLELPAVQFTVEEWDEKVDQILEAVQNSLEKRRQRLIGAGTDGQLAKELDNILQRKEKTLQPEEWLNLLLMMTQGARTMYDKRTHRRLLMHTTRLSYTHFAARYIDNLAPEDIAESVLEHLEQAQAAIRRHWGAAEWERLAATRPAELDESIQAGLRTVLGEERYTQTQLQPLQTLDMEEIQVVKDELGRQALTEVYRPLLLSVITDLWVEFLTQMEALRVSIGLEAYAQRDPLVQYKTRASALFQDLFSNMRLGVINRMFTFRPRPAAGAQQGARRGKESGEAEIGAGLESPLTEDLIIDYNGDEAAEDAVSGKDEAPSSESNPEIAGEETGIASVKPLALKPKHNGTPDRAKGKEARLSGAPDGAKEDDARLSKSQKRRRGRR